MISVQLFLDEFGLVRRIKAEGHAMVAGSFSPVCAAFTSAVRSFGRKCLAEPDIEVEGLAAQPGALVLHVAAYEEGRRAWLLGASDLLRAILDDLVADDPREIRVAIREYSENRTIAK